MLELFWLVFAFLYGMILGSFINVCIYRIPEKISLWSPPSTCAGCGNRIKWYDNIPLVSYVILKGKCRHCKEHISMQYPMVEMFTGFLMALMYLKLGLTPDMLFVSIIAVVLITISAIDYKTMIIPNGTIIALLVISVLYTAFRLLFPVAFIIPITILEAVIGFFAASVPLYLIAILSKGGMGGGDIKLMAAAGIFLGWKGILVAMIIGSVTGAVISLLLMAFKIKKRKDMIPFGPFLCFGILAAANFAPGIINWYMGLFSMIP